MIDHLMYKPPLKNTSWVTLILGDKHGLNMISGEKHELKFTWEVISIFFPSGSALNECLIPVEDNTKKPLGLSGDHDNLVEMTT